MGHGHGHYHSVGHGVASSMIFINPKTNQSAERSFYLYNYCYWILKEAMAAAIVIERSALIFSSPEHSTLDYLQYSTNKRGWLA